MQDVKEYLEHKSLPLKKQEIKVSLFKFWCENVNKK